MPRSLPRRSFGVGLRVAHYEHVLREWPALDFVEVISENFLSNAAAPLALLARVRERYPVVLHGVGLNLLGADPLDEAYLDRLKRLADFVDAPFVTDHLCWTASEGRTHHDLLPTPYTADLVAFAAERAAYVQRRLERPFGIENLSSYVTFERSTMTEWEFYRAVVRAADCHYMLDINNVYVSSENHGFDPNAYLAAIDYDRVLQIHLAGHTREASGLIIDTHDHPIADAVLDLYALAWRHGGPFPTLIERDDRIPPMPELLVELEAVRERVEAAERVGS